MIAKPQRFTPATIAFLRLSVPTHGVAEVARYLGIGYRSVHHQVQRHGIYYPAMGNGRVTAVLEPKRKYTSGSVAPPSEDEIESRKAQVQATWTEVQERNRRGLREDDEPVQVIPTIDVVAAKEDLVKEWRGEDYQPGKRSKLCA